MFPASEVIKNNSGWGWGGFRFGGASGTSSFVNSDSILESLGEGDADDEGWLRRVAMNIEGMRQESFLTAAIRRLRRRISAMRMERIRQRYSATMTIEDWEDRVEQAIRRMQSMEDS
jgi:hypothetical protein